MSAGVRTAFVLCAGLGHRLRPLTDQVPKPLVPVCGAALCGFALSRIARLGVERIVINTHHLPGEFARLFPEYPRPSSFAGVPVFFRHEDVLLDTAGGLKNVEDLLLPGPVLIHNGDILAELDLPGLLSAHAEGPCVSTLALRPTGGPLQVGFDAASGRVTDFRGELGSPAPRFLYTGVSVVEPSLLAQIPQGVPLSLVPVWLDVLRRGDGLGGVVLDGGEWRDIGTVEEYRRIHADLAGGRVCLEPPGFAGAGWPQWCAGDARIAPDAELRGWSWIGPGADVGAGAVVEDTILWRGARVEPGAVLRRTVVREGCTASGQQEDAVL